MLNLFRNQRIDFSQFFGQNFEIFVKPTFGTLLKNNAQ